MASSNRRYPRCSSASTPNATTAVISPAGNIGTPNSRCSPIAAPTNSARSVAIAMISACTHSPRDTGLRKCSRHSSGRSIPVAMPTFADRYCTSIAITFAATTTQARAYPCRAPAAMLVAKLPGSTYATAATNAGPSSATAPRSRPRERSAATPPSATGASAEAAARVAPAGSVDPAGARPVINASPDRRTEAQRLRCAGVRGRLVQPLVQRAELGHQRPAAAPGRLLLGDQRVGGEQQPGHRRPVLKRRAADPQRVDDAQLQHVAVPAVQRVEALVDA